MQKSCAICGAISARLASRIRINAASMVSIIAVLEDLHSHRPPSWGETRIQARNKLEAMRLGYAKEEAR